MHKLLLKNGKIFDSKNKEFYNGSILIVNDKIEKIFKENDKIEIDDSAEVIELEGKIVSPGFIDIHTHLREPGQTSKENIRTGTQAAARGGFTTVCCMPNTEPVIDNLSVVEFVNRQAESKGSVNVKIIGAITKKQEGKELAEIGLMKTGGIIAVSDDGKSVKNPYVLRNAMNYAKSYDIPVISHCEDPDLSGGTINAGKYSTLLGLGGIPSIAEEIIIARDALLAQETNSKLHIAHLSTAQGIEIIEMFRKKNVKITCEATPHHLTLNDSYLTGFDTNYKVNPPLRSEEDQNALIDALNKGIINIIATDHAPHGDHEKNVEFDKAPFGINGLETAFAQLNTFLVKTKKVSLETILKKMTYNPADIFKLDRGIIEEGKPADIIVIDPDEKWIFKKEEMLSRSSNTPMLNKELQGKIKITIVNGKIKWQDK